MSVINKMLQDLEKRQQQGASAEYVAPPKPRFRMLWLLLPAMLLAALTWRLWPHDETRPAAAVSAQAEAPQARPMREVAPAKTSAASRPTEPNLSADPAPVTMTDQALPAIAPTAAPVAASASETPAVLPAQTAPEAAVQVKAADDSADANWQQLRAKANAALAEGDTGQATIALHKMLVVAPDNAAVRHKLAELYVKLGQRHSAKQLLEEGLDLDPAQPLLRLSLARVQLNAQERDAAMATLVASNPSLFEHADYYATRAVLARQTANFEQAISDYLALSRHQPEQVRWRLGLAISLDQAGRTQDALAQYRWLQQQNRLAPAAQDFVQQRLRALGG